MVWKSQNNFSSHLGQDILSGRIFEHVPQDVKLVDSAAIIALSGVSMVVASPDCQPFSSAANQLGFKDNMAASFLHCLRIVKEIHSLADQPLHYVIENVPGAGRFKNIVDCLGLPLTMSAHQLGSSARRETLLWTNAHPREFLQSHLTTSRVPITTMGEILRLHGFDNEWSAPEDLLEKVFPNF